VPVRIFDAAALAAKDRTRAQGLIVAERATTGERQLIFELDHVFLGTAAPEADEATLAKFGFRFTQRRIHMGQGTANACTAFENAFLELLYAHDRDDLRSDLVSPLGLGERIHWQETGACPFGICFRATAEDSVPDSWPFATWRYWAKHLPPGVAIPIATPRNAFMEPLLFLPPQPRKPAPQKGDGEMSHGRSLRTLTGVKVKRPTGSPLPSSSVSWFMDNGFISLEDDVEYLLELEFNNGRERESHRFPDNLPLKLYW
jgi:hypothetical protein